MVDVKISELPAATAVDAGDEFEVAKAGSPRTSKRATLSMVGTFLGANPPSNLAQLNVEDQALTGGARVTAKDLGTAASGTVTPDPGDRPHQRYINGGAHTLAPGTNEGSYLLLITNNASAGAITTSGWTKVAGDAFTTTDGHKFLCHCSVLNGNSTLIVQALQ